MKEAATIAHDNAPSLTPLVTLLADDMEQVNAQIVARMASDVPLVPELAGHLIACLLYTSPSPRDRTRSRMPSSA